MKKSVISSMVFLLVFNWALAQIPLKTTKPVTTREVTKPNTISPTGTYSESKPILSETIAPTSFYQGNYFEIGWAARSYELAPSFNTYGFFAVDYDGNGIKDIAYRDFYLNDLSGCFFSSPDGFNIQYQSGHDWAQYSSIGMLGYISVSGDVNGDQKPDLIGVSPSSRKIGVISSISPLNNAGYPVHQLANSQIYSDLPSHFSDQFLPLSGDFNGDRKGDLALWFYLTGEWQIALSDGSRLNFTSNAWISGYGFGKGNYQPVTGDFNGDGFTDIAIRDNQKGTWSVAINERNQTFSPTYGCEGEFWIQGWNTDYNTLFRSGDFNGDRMDDLVAFIPATSTWQYVISSGNCFKVGSNPIQLGDANSFPLVADMNGDGKADLVAGNVSPGGNYAKLILQVSLNTGK